MRWGILVLILWTVVLFGLLLFPIKGTMIPPFLGFRHWDIVAHLGLFFITGIFAVLGAGFLSRFRSRMLFGIVFGLFLAAFTELGQSLVPFRDTSLFDLLADVLGLGGGLVLYALLYIRCRGRVLFKV